MTSRGTVLVIDDDPSVLDYLSRILRRDDYGVVAHLRPHEALAWWLEHQDEVQVIVTDVVMPGMTGLELVEKIRETGATTPVLLISGYPDRVPKSIAAGVAPLLQKPFGAQELLDAIEQALA